MTVVVLVIVSLAECLSAIPPEYNFKRYVYRKKSRSVSGCVHTLDLVAFCIYRSTEVLTFLQCILISCMLADGFCRLDC